MAALQNIRDKAGVVVATIIGLALLAFIVGDFSGSGQALFSESKLRVLEAGGESVQIQDFESRLNDYTEYIKMTTGQQSFDETQMMSIRDQVYQQMLSEIVMGAEYKASGLGISSDEIFDMVQGSDPHPYVRQLFTDPQTGNFDKSVLLQFLKNMDLDATGAQRKFWLNLERDITNQRLATKFTQLVGKGLYVPKFLAKADYLENEKTVSFTYVGRPYSSVPDSSVLVSQAEIKKYYNDNLSRFEQEESRDFDYVVFPVKASAEDRVALESDVLKLKEDFNTASDAAAFLSLNSDEPMSPYFWKKEELPVQIQALFDAEPGTVIGPYEEEGSLKVSKMVKTSTLPDSIKIRQIVLKPAATTTAQAALSDSAKRIKSLLDKGASFESVYAQYSEKDATLPANGDMGWISYGQVPDTLYMIPKGGSMVMETAQATFILEIADRAAATKRVQIGTLVKTIEAGTQTLQQIYSEASQFAGENKTLDDFVKSAGEKSLQIIPSVRVAPNDQVISGITSSPREVIRWAYGAEPKEVSPIFDLKEVYVVAVLKAIHEKGPMSLEEASYEITQTLLKQKKAKVIAGEMTAAGKDIETVAAAMSLPLDTLNAVNFASYTLPSIGMEYKVLGTAFGMKPGSVSNPVEGANAVFLLRTNQVNEAAETQDYSAGTTRLDLSFQNRANYESYEALVKIAKVKDLRVKFY